MRKQKTPWWWVFCFWENGGGASRNRRNCVTDDATFSGSASSWNEAALSAWPGAALSGAAYSESAWPGAALCAWHGCAWLAAFSCLLDGPSPPDRGETCQEMIPIAIDAPSEIQSLDSESRSSRGKLSLDPGGSNSRPSRLPFGYGCYSPFPDTYP